MYIINVVKTCHRSTFVVQMSITAKENLQAASLSISDVTHSISCPAAMESKITDANTGSKQDGRDLYFTPLHLNKLKIVGSMTGSQILDDTAYRGPQSTKHAIKADITGLQGEQPNLFIFDPLLCQRD